MEHKKFDTIQGRGVPIPGDDIDTDRIIPAQFMKCVTFDGLGEFAFHGERFDEDGNSKNHPLDAPQHKGATVIISGRSFGSGSSREHAPQALYRFGIRAIIAESFAEIFFGNSTKLGMPCVAVSAEAHAEIEAWANANPADDLTIDLVNKVITADGNEWKLDMNESARQALLSGEWDPLQQLIANDEAIAATAASLPYIQWAAEG